MTTVPWDIQGEIGDQSKAVTLIALSDRIDQLAGRSLKQVSWVKGPKPRR